jgi:hypothetical protein
MEVENPGGSAITGQALDPSPVVDSGITTIVDTNGIPSDPSPGESSSHLQRERELEQGLQTKNCVQNTVVDSSTIVSSDPGKCIGTPSSSARGIKSDVETARDNGTSARNSAGCSIQDLPYAESSNGKHKVKPPKLNGSTGTGKLCESRVTSTAPEKHSFVARAQENVVGDGASSSQDSLKVHLTEVVKKQIWPWYLTEGLGTTFSPTEYCNRTYN